MTPTPAPRQDREVVGHLGFEREAREHLVALEVQRVLAGPQRCQHDPVAVRGERLGRARDARVEGLQAHVRREAEEPRGRSVVEEVVQVDAVQLDLERRRPVENILRSSNEAGGTSGRVRCASLRRQIRGALREGAGRVDLGVHDREEDRSPAGNGA